MNNNFDIGGASKLPSNISSKNPPNKEITDDAEISIIENNTVDKIETTSSMVSFDELNDALSDEDKNITRIDGINAQSLLTPVKASTVEQSALNAIEAELEKRRNEIKTQEDSLVGLGALWNGAKGLVGLGTKGEKNSLEDLEELYLEAQKNPTKENIEKLYLAVYGEDIDWNKIESSQDVAKNLANGEYIDKNGEPINLEDVADTLSYMAESLDSSFNDTVYSQGILSKTLGFLNNNIIGLGQTENMTQAQIDLLKENIQKLSETTDPDEFAALYKQITGEDLTQESLQELLEGTSKLENTKAAENMMDYESTQETLITSFSGAVVGIATATTGPLGGALVGAAINTGIKTVDVITQTNGQNPLENFYDYVKSGDLVKDCIVGGIGGFSGCVANKASQAITSLMGNTTSTLTKTGIRLASEYADGAVDGAISNAGEYMVDAAMNNEEISLSDLASKSVLGGVMGGLFSVGMQEGTRALTNAIKGLTGEIDALDISSSKNTVPDNIYVLEDSNKIGVKLSNGNIEELNISQKAYSKLFPLGNENIVKQQQIGDCYLVSAIYTMMENDNAKAVILKCFTENADGSITVKLPKGNFEFTLQADEAVTDFVSETKLVDGSLGFQMLEYVYGLELLDNQQKEICQQLYKSLNSQSFSIRRIDFLESLKEFDFDNLDELYKKFDEMPVLNNDFEDAFINLDEDYMPKDNVLGDFADSAKDYICNKFLIQTDDGIKLNTEYIEELIGIEQKNLNTIDPEVTSLNNEMGQLLDSSIAEELRGNGGYSNNVFKMFGFENSDLIPLEQKAVDMLLDEDNWSNYVFCCSHEPTAPNSSSPIVDNHAYSLKPIKKDGEILFEAVNPWDTGTKEIYTLEEIKKYFKYFYYAKIN